MRHRDPKTHWTNERRIAKVNQGTEKRKKIVTKKRLLCFYSSFDSECWPISRRTKRQLEAVEIWFKRILKFA